MTGLVLLLICILLISLSVWLFQRGLRQAGTDRVLERLSDGQPVPQEPNGSWVALERMFQRAGLGKRERRPTQKDKRIWEEAINKTVFLVQAI